MTEPTPKQKAFVVMGPTIEKQMQSRKDWNASKAVRPKTVKVQKCPGFTGVSQFEPAKTFEGSFIEEWKQLRGQP